MEAGERVKQEPEGGRWILEDLEARIAALKEQQQSGCADLRHLDAELAGFERDEAARKKRPRREGVEADESQDWQQKGHDEEGRKDDALRATMSKNAIACKRSREKRKATLEGLRRRNRELEDQRHIFLERIAELQIKLLSANEVHKPDISRENELLRNEIAQYKTLIQNIVDATTSSPPVLHEERVRELRGYTNKCVNDAAGLLHSSPSWTEGPVVPLGDGLELRFRFQMLPIGAAPEHTKRFNIRIEIHNLPMDANKLADKFWDSIPIIWRNKIAHEAPDRVKRAFVHFDAPKLSECSEYLDARLKCYQYSEDRSRMSTGETIVSLISLLGFTREHRMLDPRDILPTLAGGTDAQSEPQIPSTGLMPLPITSFADITKTFERAGFFTKEHLELLTTARTPSVTVGNVFIPGTPDANGNPRCHFVDVLSNPVGYFRAISSIDSFYDADNGIGQVIKDDMVSYAKLVISFAKLIDRPQDELPTKW
ncbi:Hypothetical Protein FCC1311_094002 [Hondaea fermentalgiana]|uniref:BZIP domain-containing protein n=1 Tax=Hondaea fermentalgiana TaxID=2315210 RepID=A0A2R5GQL5_9STRA|nr:Hypothetical Protein FCC1311_094002 [Hondaea fermentalgiana]|eukprot:GBG33176.1 Hypothetical Protein FCC1311_094002 [Hondaea fermentalgiana]